VLKCVAVDKPPDTRLSTSPHRRHARGAVLEDGAELVAKRHCAWFVLADRSCVLCVVFSWH
jgi:hypothetical protein